MNEDHALEALESTKEQLGVHIPTPLLGQILEVEKRYAFDRDQGPLALKEIEQLIDATLRAGDQT